MDASYGARYADLYRRHFWWRARAEIIADLLRRRAPEGGFGSILDVGCGDGLSFDLLRAFGEPEGLEVDPALVTDQGRAAGTIHVQPFDKTFQPANRYGLITFFDVIEHLDDDIAALRHARSLLVPGGQIIITVPALQTLWTRHDDYNHHRRRYTRKTLHAAASAAGLSVVTSRYIFHWLAVAKLVVKLRESLTSPPSKADLPSVPAAPVNNLMLSLCRLERMTWGRLPWPFGSSLIAVVDS
ncbi:MAG: class I SAM-dependent methyltransferase [Acidobacteriota bacterium]